MVEENQLAKSGLRVIPGQQVKIVIALAYQAQAGREIERGIPSLFKKLDQEGYLEGSGRVGPP